MNKIFKQKAFTLAEILIVLAIIGSIAALTVPSLYSRINPGEKQCELGLQKAIIAVDDALKKMMILDSTSHTLQNLTYTGSADKFLLDSLGKYMQFTKTCTSNTECKKLLTGGNSSISTSSAYKLEGADGNLSDATFNIASYPGGVTSDGMVFITYNYYKTCASSSHSLSTFKGNAKNMTNICGVIYVDVNGPKGPNKAGYDRYKIVFGKTGIKRETTKN